MSGPADWVDPPGSDPLYAVVAPDNERGRIVAWCASRHDALDIADIQAHEHPVLVLRRGWDGVVVEHVRLSRGQVAP